MITANPLAIRGALLDALSSAIDIGLHRARGCGDAEKATAILAEVKNVIDDWLNFEDAEDE